MNFRVTRFLISQTLRSKNITVLSCEKSLELSLQPRLRIPRETVVFYSKFVVGKCEISIADTISYVKSTIPPQSVSS